jgi:ADP-ribose pyrophosphatase YjhB (NUDIX family)
MPTAEELAGWRACPRCGTELEHEERSVSCFSCGLAVYASPAPTASAIVLDAERRVLLAQRAGDPGKGLWDLPGGFMDEGEEPLETLRRELREEAGVDVEPLAYVGALPDRYGEGGGWTMNLYWSARIVSGEPEPSDDVAAFAWFETDELPPPEQFAFRNTVEILCRFGAKISPPEREK